MMFSPQLIPLPTSKRRLLPIIPAEEAVPVSFDSSVPTSSFTGSFMCQTLRYPLDALKTADPLD